MVKREKRKAKVEESEEDEERKEQKGSIPVVGESVSSSDDDAEANEDLRLNFVEKAMLRHAGRGKLSNQGNGSVISEVVEFSGIIRRVEELSSSSIEADAFVNASTGIQWKKKEKKRTLNAEVGDQFVMVLKEEENAEIVEKSEVVEAAELIKRVDCNTVEVSDNIVLRKLLRGPRYFDPPNSGWTSCYNCGEEGHMAVNCKSLERKKKPCFMCGALDHHGKQCPKGQDCFICKKGGHRAKDCPDKWSSLSKNSKICLKCGEPGHDMFSCRNGYSPDDLKEIQCYHCKSFGHLCCVKFVHDNPRVISCYKCGGLGHNGLTCSRLHEDDTGTARPTLCYKCGEEGHFACECISATKAMKRNCWPTTPTLRAHDGKQKLGSKSAHQVLDNTGKKKKFKYEERVNTAPQKSKKKRWMDYRISWVKIKTEQLKIPFDSIF